jgi:hypothetical protein
MFAITLLFVISMTFTNLYEARMRTAEIASSELEARALAEKLAGAISAVYAAGENTEVQLLLPTTIGTGVSYRVWFDRAERAVIIEGDALEARAGVGIENVLVGLRGATGEFGSYLDSSLFENRLRILWGQKLAGATYGGSPLDNWIVVTLL